MVQKISNWFGNEKKKRDEGKGKNKANDVEDDGDIGEEEDEDSAPDSKRHWTERKVINRMFRHEVATVVARMAKEDGYPANKAHLKFGQLALNEVVAGVEKDKESHDRMKDLVEKWNSATPLAIRAE